MRIYVTNPTVEQEEVIKAFLEEKQISFIKEENDDLPDFVLTGIRKAQESIAAGNFITHDEFKKRLLPVKSPIL